MPSKKKYYWLKLYEEFFNQTSMKYIRKLPDGEKITIIYLKLLLESLKTEGFICMEGLFPTIEEELALHLDEDLLVVQFSLAALEKAKLLERGSGDWEICMTKLPEMIGSESNSAHRVRAFRERQALAEKEEGVTLKLPGNTTVTDVKRNVTNGNTEKEIEKKKETEIETEPDTEGEQTDSGPHFYGVDQNVVLTASEYDSLKKLYPDYLAKIDYFSAYMANTGKHYDNHYFTIMQWAKQDDLKRPASEVKKSGFPDYSFEEGESF